MSTNPAKQVRKPFNTVRKRAERPLQIVHTDVCGPISPETWNHKRYYVTFLDDYTHFADVVLLKNKSDVEQSIKNYIARTEAFHSLEVSMLRCDNGGEYVSNSLIFWCEQ